MKKQIIVNSPKEVIVTSTYAGKEVRGVAKCDPRDKFDEAIGIKLATARHDVKITRLRYSMASKRLIEADKAFSKVQKERGEAYSAFWRADVDDSKAWLKLKELERSLRG